MAARFARFACIILLLFALLPVAFTAGCAAGGSGKTGYVVRRRGVVVGTETVDREVGKDGSVTCSGSAKRPFLEYDTAAYTRVVVDKQSQLTRYYQNLRRNGVAFNTEIVKGQGVYEYTRNDLQTFNDFTLQAEPGNSFLPFEPDSAAPMQALVDRFRSSQSSPVNLLVMVPSTTTLLRDTVITRKGAGELSVAVKALDDYTVAYDESSGRLKSFTARSTGTVVETGSAGAMVSRPYAPTKRTVNDVRVPVVGNLELAGSLYVPKGKAPFRAVVLVGDFGPQDRTGVGVLSGIADRLANDGLLVLTCDRRGVRPSDGSYPRYTLDTAVSDLNSQVDFLFLRSDVDAEHIYVLGYGEGGVVATTVANANPYVAGCVLMATPSVRVFPDLPLLQASEALSRGVMSQPVYDEQVIEINALVSLVVQYQVPFLKIGSHLFYLEWMRRYMSNDEPASLRTLQVPVLLLQGADDTKVPAGQSELNMSALSERAGGVQQLVTLPGTDHLFGPLVGEAAAKPFRSHAVPSKATLDALSGWFKERKASK